MSAQPHEWGLAQATNPAGLPSGMPAPSSSSSSTHLFQSTLMCVWLSCRTDCGEELARGWRCVVVGGSVCGLNVLPSLAP